MEKQFKGVAHAAFNVSDMDKAVQFYHDVFGFEKAFEMAHPVTGEPWIVYLHAGGSQFIELFYGGVNPQEYKDGNIGYSHICFEVADINKTAEQIVKAGAYWIRLCLRGWIKTGSAGPMIRTTTGLN